MPKRKKTVWKSIKVPSEVHTFIKVKAKRENVAMHKVIVSAALASEVKDISEVAEKISLKAKNIDKAIWYNLKLVNGIAMYKQLLKLKGKVSGAYVTAMDEYRVEQRKKLSNTINQIEKRLKVDLDEVRDAIEELEERYDNKVTMKLNDAVKKAMFAIINKVVE